MARRSERNRQLEIRDMQKRKKMLSCMTASKHFLNPQGALSGCLWCLLTLNTPPLWTYCLFAASYFSFDETFLKSGNKSASVR